MTTTFDRFFMKVQKTPTCWLWTASKTQTGYGMFGTCKDVSTAHRWSYSYHVGPIFPKMQIDHLCRVRACVNPAHLEQVTAKENNRRARLARQAPQERVA